MRSKLMPMMKLFLIQCALTMLLAFPISYAEARGANIVQENIHTFLERGDTLDLIAELGISRQLNRGAKIVQLSIQAEGIAQNGRGRGRHNQAGKVKVFINGSQTQVITLTRHSSNQVINLIQRNIQTIEIKGKSAFISTVTAKLANRNQQPTRGGQVTVAHLDKYVVGGDILKIRQEIKRSGQTLNGKKIKKIVIVGEIFTRGVKAQLLINRRPVGMPVRTRAMDGRLVFILPQGAANTVGRDIRALQVEILRGQMIVEKIKVKSVKRRGRNFPVPRPQQSSVKIQINKQMRGTELINLGNEASNQVGQQAQRKQVQSLTISARGQGSIMVIANGQIQGTINIQGRFGSPRTVGLRQMATMRNIMFRTTGNIRFDSVTAQFSQSTANRGNR